jgi:hypothetical protein
MTGSRVVQMFHVIGSPVSRHSIYDHLAHSSRRPHAIIGKDPGNGPPVDGARNVPARSPFRSFDSINSLLPSPC